MSDRNCGTCKAADTWCWMFTINKGECPCAHCPKNKDCDIVMEDDDNKGEGLCQKFNKVWPD
jgi:hypothetical protein